MATDIARLLQCMCMCLFRPQHLLQGGLTATGTSETELCLHGPAGEHYSLCVCMFMRVCTFSTPPWPLPAFQFKRQTIADVTQLKPGIPRGGPRLQTVPEPVLLTTCTMLCHYPITCFIRAANSGALRSSSRSLSPPASRSAAASFAATCCSSPRASPAAPQRAAAHAAL